VILRSIIALAHDLAWSGGGRREPIRRHRALSARLRNAQGFVFGEPMSAEDARTLLLSNRLETVR